MGQKANPISNRISLNPDWDSKWFAKRDYRHYLTTDLKIRDFVKKTLIRAGVGRVEIIRSRDKLAIRINTARPGLIIGRGGQGIKDLEAKIQKMFYPNTTPIVRIEITENKTPDMTATLVAQNIASQIERRIQYKKAAKSAIERIMANSALGAKIIIAGRLNGAEISRDEKFQEGSIPLSRFQFNIDYGTAEALTDFGIIGIKVWINKGKIEETTE